MRLLVIPVLLEVLTFAGLPLERRLVLPQLGDGGVRLCQQLLLGLCAPLIS
jgi:hypothetical protein